MSPAAPARGADQILGILAEAALEAPGDDLPVTAEYLAWARLTPEERVAAWHEFRRAVLDHDALMSGQRDWTDMYPEAGGQAAAAERAASRMSVAFEHLAWGRPGARP